MIGTVIGHYEILSKLGEGGMGVVYKARDTQLNRFVALKFLPGYLISDDEQRERFRREAQSASSLDHPNICTVYEIGKTNQEQLFISMAYYEGATLKMVLHEKRLPLKDILRYSVQIARGLSRAHESDVVHRDIKPANIVVTTRDEIKILDFGLAKLARSTGLTRTGTTMGTVAYMSPEQAKGAKVDRRTDIWSLGIIMYEMLAGRQPYHADFEHAVIYAIVNEDPPALAGIAPDLPTQLIAIVEKAMAKDVNKRYATAEELLADLEPLKNRIAGESPITGTRTRHIARPRKSTAWVTGVVSVAAVVALGLFFPWQRGSSSESETQQSAAKTQTPPLVVQQPESPVTETPQDTVQATVAKQTPPPTPVTAKAEPVRTAEPKSQPVAAAPDRSADVKRARRDLRLAKTDAEAASAATFASDDFVAAVAAEVEAEKLADDGAADKAIAQFAAAQTLYATAATDARRASETLSTQAETLRAKARQVMASAPADYKFLAEYKTAVTMNGAGDERMKERDYEAASHQYESAITQYDVAVSTRERQVADINRTVERFARALEAEDLRALTALHSSLSREAKDSWNDFFRAVSNLEAQMTVDDIHFNAQGATALLSVRLIYSGAQAQGDMNHWDVDMNEQDGTWLISEVRRKS